MLVNHPLAGNFAVIQANEAICFKQAQTSTDTRRLGAYKAIIMTTRLIALIELKIHEKWRPEQISGWLRKDQGTNISYATI